MSAGAGRGRGRSNGMGKEAVRLGGNEWQELINGWAASKVSCTHGTPQGPPQPRVSQP